MITTMPAPFREPEDRTLKWVILFILISLLLHAILFTVIVVMTHLIPPPKFPVPEPPPESKINLTLLPPPAPVQKRIFIPTQPQQNVLHKEQRVESANDTVLKSQSQTARDSTSIMPDINGKPHAPDMRNSPEVKAPKQQQVSTTQPTPRQTQAQKPIPSPKPQMAPQMQPRPLPPQPKPAPPKAQPQQQQVDPVTGLPVLPPISAQTLSPPDQSRPLAPTPSQAQVAGSVHGAIGQRGDNSPAAMQSDLGKYKQYVYEVVGSYWYPEVDKKFGAIGVGSVTIRFTIHSDGTISDVEVIDGETNQILKSISQNALVSPAPFNPFTPGMIKEVGTSYTDEFSFATY